MKVTQGQGQSASEYGRAQVERTSTVDRGAGVGQLQQAARQVQQYAFLQVIIIVVLSAVAFQHRQQDFTPWQGRFFSGFDIRHLDLLCCFVQTVHLGRHHVSRGRFDQDGGANFHAAGAPERPFVIRHGGRGIVPAQQLIAPFLPDGRWCCWCDCRRSGVLSSSCDKKVFSNSSSSDKDCTGRFASKGWTLPLLEAWILLREIWRHQKRLTVDWDEDGSVVVKHDQGFLLLLTIRIVQGRNHRTTTAERRFWWGPAISMIG